MQERGRSEEVAGRPGSRGGSKKKAASRDSSVGSLGREVRCGCQYFQTDSLLPERVNLVGRPPSRTSNMAAQMGDHEYEPISPPPAATRAPAMRRGEAMELEVEEALGVSKRRGSESSIDSRERRFLRIPLDDDLVLVPGDGDDEDEAMAGRELGDDRNGDGDRERSVQELQSEMEDRYFAATPTTTASRTDCEFNTSQMDSSGLEDLPLKRDARKKKMMDMTAEQKQSQARGFQQRLRSQAGRIRTKLRNMRRPNFTMPERPKFNLPDRPKFNLPERPKFNLPDRPKFNLPERPKFNLPDRPKFSMPERPKFNFPQRPKLSMPSMSRHKTSSTRRPLRDRSQNLSTESEASSRKKIFDFDFRTYPRIFDRKSRHADYATSSPKSSRTQTPPPDMPSRKKGPVGSRWVHRFTDIKYADDENLPSGSEEGREYPEKRDEEENGRGNRDEYNDKEVFSGREQTEISDEKDREQVDEERPESRHTESTTAFHDQDYGYAITDEDNKSPIEKELRVGSSSLPESDRVEMSSNSSDRRHAGVIEEIDSDEFFLREKGLSQEDVDVGRYLTSEIRDAFRSPTNALSQMENYDYYDEDEDAENLGQQYRSTPDREPARPARTRSLRPRKKSPKTDEPTPATEEDQTPFYNTFPPTRPKRTRHVSQPQEGDTAKETVDETPKETEQEFEAEDEAQMEEVERDFESQEMEFEEQQVSTENLKQPAPSFTFTDDQDVLKGQSMEEDEEEVPLTDDQWQEDNNMDEIHPPCPPKRRKQSGRKEQVTESLCNGHYTREDWLENLESEIMAEEVIALRMESDYIIPTSPGHEYYDLPPVPPKRGHRKSSRGTSLADEDRTSRCASSLPSEREQAAEELVSEADLAEISGYAVVDKHPPKKPERPRRPKPPRPPAPTRRKRFSGHGGRGYFYSLPRRAPPVRPLRNYSTLGPSRPPRRERDIEPQYAEQDNKSESYIEMEDDHFEQSHLESHGSNRDLQSGDVIEKMKGRPLPPPPRPPRKAREGKEQPDEQIGSEDTQEYAGRMEEEAIQQHIEQVEQEPALPVNEERAAMAALSDAQFYSQQGITQTQAEIQQQEDELIRRLSEDQNEELMRRLSDEQNEELMRRLTEDQQELIRRLHEEEQNVIPQEIPEEVSVSTQTDPLPDDYCVEGFEEDEPIMTSHTDAFTEMMVQEREHTPVEEPPIPIVPPPRRNSKVNRELALLRATESIPAESASPKVECPVTIPETPSEAIPEVLPRHEFEHSPPSVPPPSMVPPPPPMVPPPPSIMHTTTIIERPVTVLVAPDSNTEIEVLRTQRLQVVELDVERLNVGEIQAQKIVVSDIDGMSMQVAELSSKSGNLVVNGIELPTGFLQDLYDSFPAPVQPTEVKPSPSEPVPVPQVYTVVPTVHTVASSTPVPETPATPVIVPEIPIQTVSVPETPRPSVSVAETPRPSVSVAETPLPSASVPQTVVPSVPISQTPVSSVPISQTPVFSVPVPQTLVSSVPISQTPVSYVPISQTPVSSVPVPQTPVSSVPVPQTPVSASQPPSPVSPEARVPVLPTSEVVVPVVSTAAPVPAASTMESIPHILQQSYVTISSSQGQPLSFQPQLVQVPVTMSPLHQVTMQSPLMSPVYQTGPDPLHSYVPDYIPTSIPMSVRVPSRQRSHVQRELESEEEMISLMPSSSRRRRHHVSKPTPRYSTDEEEEEEYSSFRPPSRRHQPRQGSEPSVTDLGRQLVQACHGFTMRATSQLLNYITPQQQEGEDKRRDLQIALCILLVLVAGLILLGFGSGKTFHYHHWDYHFPPQQ